MTQFLSDLATIGAIVAACIFLGVALNVWLLK